MKDTRGVERGKCKNCECEQYELEKGAKRAACAYCECPAPAHVALSGKDSSQISPGINLVSCNSASSSATQISPGINLVSCNSASSSATQISSNFSSVSSKFSSSSACASTSRASNDFNEGDVITLDVANLNDPFLSRLLTSSQPGTEEPHDDDIPIPCKLSRKCEEAIANRTVDGDTKHTIVREVVSNLYSKGMDSNFHLERAAKKLAQKWSPLKDPNDPEYCGLYIMLRKRRDRMNSVSNRSLLTSSSTNTEGADNLSAYAAKNLSKQHWISGKRTFATHSELMIVARPLREVEAKKLPGLQLLRAYPALSINNILLQEFYAELEISEEYALGRWHRVVSKIIPMYKEKALPCAENGTLGEQTLRILENLHNFHPLWCKGKSKDNPKARILQIYPENTPLAEYQPSARSPPHLIAIGEYVTGSLSISCFMDSEPLFTESDPVRAMLLLLATFFVGHLKWPLFTRLPLLLLTCSVAGPSKVMDDIVKNQKFIDVLKKLDAY